MDAQELSGHPRPMAPQIFFDYLERAYQLFLSGQDDMSQLEEQVAAAHEPPGRQCGRDPPRETPSLLTLLAVAACDDDRLEEFLGQAGD